jgi:hypothetical protein
MERVTWVAAMHQLRICQVKALEETHARTVTLTLLDGRKLFTHEPRTANVIHEVVRINNSGICPSIRLSME